MQYLINNLQTKYHRMQQVHLSFAVRNIMNYYLLLENTFFSLFIKWLPYKILLAIANLYGKSLSLLVEHRDYKIIQLNIKNVFTEKTNAQVTSIAKKVIFEKVKYFLDLAVLMHKSESFIKKNITGKITIDGNEHLKEALSAERGVFLVSAHFACFYYMLLAEMSELKEINMLKAFNSSARENLYDKLENITTKEINGINAKDKFSSMRTYKKLKAKKLVACMFDNFLDGTTLVEADFLGHSAVASAGVAVLAIKSNAVLLPATIVRSKDGYIFEIDKMIDSAKYSTLSMNDQIVKLTTDLNQSIENWIKKHPDQWQAWATLDRKWNLLDEQSH